MNTASSISQFGRNLSNIKIIVSIRINKELFIRRTVLKFLKILLPNNIINVIKILQMLFPKMCCVKSIGQIRM